MRTAPKPWVDASHSTVKGVANDALLCNSIFPAPPPPPAPAGPNSALVAARAAAKEGLVRVREAAIAWECEQDAADALARQIADAEQLLGLPTSPEVGATSSGSAGPRVAHTAVI